MLNPMPRYAVLSFKIYAAEDETHPADNLSRAPQAQSNIPGSWSGNKGDHNTHGSFNNINMFALPRVPDFGVQNESNILGVEEPGIIRIPGGYLAKN